MCSEYLLPLTYSPPSSSKTRNIHTTSKIWRNKKTPQQFIKNETTKNKWSHCINAALQEITQKTITLMKNLTAQLLLNRIDFLKTNFIPPIQSLNKFLINTKAFQLKMK